MSTYTYNYMTTSFDLHSTCVECICVYLYVYMDAHRSTFVNSTENVIPNWNTFKSSILFSPRV